MEVTAIDLEELHLSAILEIKFDSERASIFDKDPEILRDSVAWGSEVSCLCKLYAAVNLRVLALGNFGFEKGLKIGRIGTFAFLFDTDCSRSLLTNVGK